ncbi:MAG: hypothetical protein QOI47_1676 [Actinomycetota bacterium]|nr:hypothetical protein [Actinomycetota bacterium]
MAVAGFADLVRTVDAQTDAAECWQRAEWHLLGAAFDERLVALGISPSADAGVALIAAALFLAEHTDEWGGDARDALGELAQLGRTLIRD